MTKNFDILFEKIMDDSLDRKPYEMSAAEFDQWLAGRCPIEVTGEWIIEKTGISDVNQLLDFYKRKYADRIKDNNIVLDLEDKTPEEFSKEHKSPDQAAGFTQKREDGYHIAIPTKGESPAEIVGVFRHELEHVFDLIEGYETDKPSVAPGTLEVGEKGLEGKGKFHGHHHHYEWFDTDYLRRSIVRDAMEKGKTVPEEVKKELGL